MAQLGTFDATQVEPAAPMELIPAGDYEVQIVRSELKPTKNGNGQYLELELDVIDGEYSHRKIWDRLNIVNPNEMAQQIAQRTLSAICHAVGVLHVTDSEQLHCRPMIARVSVEERKDKPGEHSNRVKSYKPRSQQPSTASVVKPPFGQARSTPTTPQATQQAAQQATAQPMATKSAPWHRSA